MKPKSNKGGKRIGAGRKPGKTYKEPITVYANDKVLTKFGGKEGVRVALYTYMEGTITSASNKFIPMELPAEIAPKTKSTSIKALTKPTNDLKPHEQAKSNYSINTEQGDELTILEQIKAIKAEKCPELRAKTPLGKKSWELDQKKRIQELEKQLK
jgi:hypothetical protein